MADRDADRLARDARRPAVDEACVRRRPTRPALNREDWNLRYAGAGLLWSAGPNRFLVQEAEGLEPGRALDLACGEGRNAIWLAERGWTVTGVDFSDVAVAKARDAAAARGVEVEWEVADLLGWRPRGLYDLVLVFYLQLPADERTAVLRTAAAALAPGGELLVVGHDSRNLERGYGGPRDPAVLFTAEDVLAALDGLEVVRAGQVERPVETEQGPRVAIDALVRARRPR